jgi:hypothetical protein
VCTTENNNNNENSVNIVILYKTLFKCLENEYNQQKIVIRRLWTTQKQKNTNTQ